MRSSANFDDERVNTNLEFKLYKLDFIQDLSAHSRGPN